MKNRLDELCSMQGVNGAFLCTDEGELLVFSALPIYDAETLTHAANAVAHATESIGVQYSQWENLVANFKDGKLILNKVKQHILCVISDTGANLPFLNVAIKVARNKLERALVVGNSGMGDVLGTATNDERFSSQFSSDSELSNASDLSGGMGSQSGFHQGMYSSTVQHVSSINANLNVPMNSSLTGTHVSGLFWSGMGAVGVQSSVVAVADESASKLLTRVSIALAEIVGPMAKVFVKETVQTVCPIEPFSIKHYKALVQEIERLHITESDELNIFRELLSQ